MTTTLFTFFVSIADMLNALPENIKNLQPIEKILSFYKSNLPFFDLGMGWIIPMIAGLVIGLIISAVTKPKSGISK